LEFDFLDKERNRLPGMGSDWRHHSIDMNQIGANDSRQASMRNGSAFPAPAASSDALPRAAVAATHILRCQSAKSWGGSMQSDNAVVPLSRTRKKWLRRTLPIAAVAALATGGIITLAPIASASPGFEVENLNGSGNNVNNPTWGQAGTPYARVGTAHYADGISQPFTGPNARFISNRITN